MWKLWHRARACSQAVYKLIEMPFLCFLFPGAKEFMNPATRNSWNRQLLKNLAKLTLILRPSRGNGNSFRWGSITLIHLRAQGTRSCDNFSPYAIYHGTRVCEIATLPSSTLLGSTETMEPIYTRDLLAWTKIIQKIYHRTPMSRSPLLLVTSLTSILPLPQIHSAGIHLIYHNSQPSSIHLQITLPQCPDFG